jgi:hypothetical protein
MGVSNHAFVEGEVRACEGDEDCGSFAESGFDGVQIGEFAIYDCHVVILSYARWEFVRVSREESKGVASFQSSRDEDLAALPCPADDEDVFRI